MPETKERVVSFDSVFLNSKCIFIEYIDIMTASYIGIAKMLSMKEEVEQYGFDYSAIHGLPDEELTDWYVGRKYQNLFKNFLKDSSSMDSNTLNKFLDEQIKAVPELLDMCNPLNMANVIGKLYAKDNLIADKAIIWYPYENDAVRKNIKKLIPGVNPDYYDIAFGPIEETIAKMPEDSTYVFSNITNIGVLDDMGKLNYSSIIIPQEYGYNAEDGKFIVDTDKMLDHGSIFKLDYFYATE